MQWNGKKMDVFGVEMKWIRVLLKRKNNQLVRGYAVAIVNGLGIDGVEFG
jgi:hypothetical protein